MSRVGCYNETHLASKSNAKSSTAPITMIRRTIAGEEKTLAAKSEPLVCKEATTVEICRFCAAITLT